MYYLQQEKTGLFLCGLEVKKGLPGWYGRWTDDRSRAYRFWSLPDARRYRDILLVPDEGPYQLMELKPKVRSE